MQTTVTHQESRASAGDIKRVMRHNYFIDKNFQSAFVFNMLLITGVAMFATALVVAWFFVYFMQDRLSGAIDTPYLIKLGTILFFMAAGIVLWTIRRTHAVAGPIFKTRKILRAAARGEFPETPVRFRRGDAFQALAADLNACLTAMRAHRQPGCPKD